MSETDQAPLPTLLQKLHEIALTIDGIGKTGRNEHHKYDYVEAANVNRKIRAELLQRRIIVFPGASNVQHFADTGGKGFVTTLDLQYRFIDVDSREEETLYWVGAGADTGGDKGSYKSYTGGLKYALLNLFLIPTGDDPERDEVTEAASESVSKDAARPASPSIPMDRATGILELATKAGLATVETVEGKPVVTLMPVLKAKLAEVGVNSGKIAHLNVDQAEDVEKFLKAEVAA